MSKNDNEKINSAAIIAQVFLKFPWLREKIDPKEVKQVTFQNITSNLLFADSGYTTQTKKGLCDPILKKRIYFFSQGGKFLGQVGSMPFTKTKRWFGIFGNRGRETTQMLFQEDVKSAIERIEQLSTDIVYYIIGLLPDNDEDLSSMENLIFTAPREGQSLTEAFTESAIQTRTDLEKKISQHYGRLKNRS